MADKFSIFSNLFKRTDINDEVKKYEKTPSAVMLDVRSKEEFKAGHIPGSINIPVDDILEVEDAIPDHDTPIYVYCLSGARSRKAVDKMRMLGYKNAKSIGGISAYTGFKVT